MGNYVEYVENFKTILVKQKIYPYTKMRETIEKEKRVQIVAHALIFRKINEKLSILLSFVCG